VSSTEDLTIEDVGRLLEHETARAQAGEFYDPWVLRLGKAWLAQRDIVDALEKAHAVHVEEDGAVNWGCAVCALLAGVPVAEAEQ